MSAYSKTILCLANSWKTSGRCIAGKEITEAGFAEWVRPVSARTNGELSETERLFANGHDPKVLDIVRIVFKKPSLHRFQRENHLIDPDRHWVWERKATTAEVLAAVDHNDRPLWRGGSSSTHGQNDRVHEFLARRIDGSLRLISVDDLTVHVEVEGAEFDAAKRKVRGRFTYNGSTYILGITDPILRREFLGKANGRHAFGRALLCVSLGEPYRTYAYKLIAAVIRPPNP